MPFRTISPRVGLIALTCALGCGPGSDPPTSQGIPQREMAPRVATQTHKPPSPGVPLCEERLRGIAPAPEAGYPDLNALAHIVFETKVRSRIYFARPVRDSDPAITRVRSSLVATERPKRRIRALKERYNNNKSFLRRLFLLDGYLFEERPAPAAAVVEELALADLFDAPYIYRLEEGEIERLILKDEGYFTSGGQPATLVLNDRVAAHRDDLEIPMHLDLDEVMRETGARRGVVRVIGEGQAWVDLIFPDGERRPALVVMDGTRTKVGCIGGDLQTLGRTLDKAAEFAALQGRMTEAAEALAAERPRFDEPLDEADDVQEDGDLRLEWSKAYQRRKRTFMFRDTEYKVFDYRGNPTPPEVCVDFIFDVWERTHGTWYTKRGTRPGKTSGTIDFAAVTGLSRRHVPSILAFTATSDSPFERYDVPQKDWYPLEKHRRFISSLLAQAPAIREGDALVIHGLREEDMKEHFHTVLVLRTDPLTGIPTRVADNQGRPRLSTLGQAMRAAPKRAVKYRLRVDFEKLKKLTAAFRQRATLPP